MDRHAFDARKAWLAEGRSISSWRTVSLVTAVRALADVTSTPMGEGRTRLMLDCLAELTRRGIDGDSLLRFGLAPEVMAPLVYRQVFRSAGFEGLLATHSEQSLDELEGWDDLLGVATDLPVTVGVVLESIPPAFMWVMAAPLADLVRLKAPSRSDFERFLSLAAPETAIIDQYRWLVDRFSTTRIQEWETASLHLEYQSCLGELPSLCADRLLEDRRVDSAELNSEIAARSVRPRSSRPTPYSGALAQQMQRQAEDLLGSGQAREAAALFEFALTQDASDAIALNNLGFCQLTQDPQAAIANLQKARANGYRPLIVNVYNEVFGFGLISRPRHALGVAEQFWQTFTSGVRLPQGAVLWRANESAKLVLVTVQDCRLELARLCVELASRVDDEHERLWSQREKELRGA